MNITQEMIDRSAQEEQEILGQSPEVLLAQNRYLNNRVVVLRALVNEQQAKLKSTEEELEKLKSRPRANGQARKAPVKKVTSKK